MKKSFLIIICACLAAFLLGACSSSSDSETPAGEESTEAAVDLSELYGQWQEDAFLSGFIFKSDGTGTDTFWDLTFTYGVNADGTLALDYDSELYGTSVYEFFISGDELTMTRLDEDEETEPFTYTRVNKAREESSDSPQEDAGEEAAEEGESEADGEGESAAED